MERTVILSFVSLYIKHYERPCTQEIKTSHYSLKQEFMSPIKGLMVGALRGRPPFSLFSREKKKKTAET